MADEITYWFLKMYKAKPYSKKYFKSYNKWIKLLNSIH